MARGIREESRIEEGRKARIPVGVPRSKLAVPEIRGYQLRWFNDLEGRIQQAQAGGYEFVEQDEAPTFGNPDVDNVNRDLGARVSRVVDKSTGMKAYLMKIKKEYYEEDQQAKQAIIDETDRQIRKGRLHDADNRYVPDNGRGIRIETR